jgi:GNAT superfamily N-acetyltransferase
MSADDLQEVVEVHLQSFPSFFLTFLGPKFLTLLYQNIPDCPEGVAIVASLNGRVEGFIAGVTQQKGFYRRIIKEHKWAFAAASLGALIKRPAIAPRLIRALRKQNEVGQASAEACLMSIAVRPEMEGRGIGKQIVEAFCKALRERGVKAVCLTTDQDNNERVNRFYQKLGFRITRCFITPEGRTMNEYIISLE